MSYTLRHYGDMIQDEVRVGAYAEALRRTMKPGFVVVDVGAGAGVFSLLAAQLGASKVYAVEPNPVVDIGQLIIDANGEAGRIKFIKGTLDGLELPERADLIVADLRGTLPLLQGSARVLLDARDRLLKPGGILIPQQDQIFAAYISAQSFYERRVVSPWASNSLDLNMRAALPFQINNPIGLRWDTKHYHFLVDGQLWKALDYRTLVENDFEEELEWDVQESGTAHFVMLWFKTVLFEEISYTSGPFEGAASVYGQTLLPLSRPVSLERGNKLSLKLRIYLPNDNYEFDWQTTVWDQHDSSKPKVSLKQSTFLSRPRMGLPVSNKPHLSSLTSMGEVALAILQMIQQGVDNSAEITDHIYARFPEDFATRKLAENFVASVASRFAC